MYRRGPDHGEDGVAFFQGRVFTGLAGDEGFEGKPRSRRRRDRGRQA